MPRRPLLVLLVLLVWPSAAAAGTYDVYSCRLPDGQRIAWDGWTRFDPDVSDSATANGDCIATSLGAYLAFSTDATSGSVAGWHFSSPPDTVIRSFTIYRWARTSAEEGRQRAYDLLYDSPTTAGAVPIESCSPLAGCTLLGAFAADGLTPLDPLHAGNRIERSGLTVFGITARIRCASPDGNPCIRNLAAPGAFAIMASRFGLEDSFPPEFVGEPKGRVVTGPVPTRGETVVSFGAADRGSGSSAQLSVLMVCFMRTGL